MDDIFTEIGKGFLRGVGYILADVIFNFVFYYIGWPICKIMTLGKYPQKPDYQHLHTEHRQGLWCSFVGFLVVLFIALYFAGLFE